MVDLSVAFGMPSHESPLSSRAPVRAGMRVLLEAFAFVSCRVELVRIDDPIEWTIHNMAHGSRSLLTGAVSAIGLSDVEIPHGGVFVRASQSFAMDVEYVGKHSDGRVFRAHLLGALTA